MRSILYFQSGGTVSVREKLAGFHRVLRGTPEWNVQIIAPGASEGQVRKLLRFWTPAGIIVSGGDGGNLFDPRIFGRIPTVFLDHNPKALAHRAVCVTHDSQATASLAARELLALRLKAYAYVPHPQRTYWNTDRELGFVEAMKLNGKGAYVFQSNSRSSDQDGFPAKLAAWLSGLPRPTGVFAANDFVSQKVLTAARLAGLNVPGDVCIIGVDNDELICENANPTLSSIRPDFATAGETAARMLMRMIDGKPVKSTTFGPLQIVHRASTTRIPESSAAQTDPAILSALDLIRTNACAGLKARDVLALFTGCSRRTAELRFRAAVGRSILGEIRRVRLQHAKVLLERTSANRTSVANQCGYANASALWKLLSDTYTS